MTKLPELTTEQLSLLRAYAARNGRTWKSELNHAWMTGAINGPVYALRNSHGPSWLVRYKLPKDSEIPSIVFLIVGRCHVGESNTKVIRYFVSRLKPGAWRKLSREERKAVLRHVLHAHDVNRALYHAVMTGRF